MEDLETMLKTLKDMDFKGKRVLMRVDFNVPIGNPDGKGDIEDDFRIRSVLPTINYVLDHGASQVVLMSHLDPWDDISPTTKDPRLKMDKVAKRLSELLEQDVKKVDDCINISLPSAKVVMLENLRFYKEEKKNDVKFAEALAKNGQVYVNDAFGTCHRAHASVEAVVKYFKEYGAGLLVQKEVEMLYPVMKTPKKPFYVIMGGSKVKSKIDVIESIGKKADKIFIGGKMALAFAGVEYIDQEERDAASNLMDKFPAKLILPLDYMTEDKAILLAESPLIASAERKIYDIGSKTIKEWKRELTDAKTVFSNIIVGYFEKPPFDNGTNSLIRYMVELTKKGVITIIGGGDSASAVQKLGLQDKVSHVSTGGGASLELLEGKELPGLKVLGYYS